MAFYNFPTNPNIGDTYVVGTQTYVWNGNAWAKQPIVNASNVTAVTLRVTTSTNSTSTTTGGLVVDGGAGIGKNLSVGGDLTFSTDGTLTNIIVKSNSGTTQQWTFGTDGKLTTPGDLHVTGEIVADRLTIQYTTITTTIVETDDIISTFNTTNSTSTNTGALQVAGGAGIGGDVWVGGTMYSAGYEVITAGNFSLTGVTSLTAGAGISVNHATGDVTVINTGVIYVSAGTDTVVTQTAGSVKVWNTSTLQSITNRGAVTTNAVSINNETATSDTATGALIVLGGVGVGLDLNVGGAIVSTGDITGGQLFEYGGVRVLTSATVKAGTGLTGGGTIYGPGGSVTLSNSGVLSVQVDGDLATTGGSGNITISSTGTLQSVTSRGNTTNNAIGISNTTEANNATSGALTVAGGVGINKKLYVTGEIRQAGSLVINTATIANYAVTSLVASPGLYVDANQGAVTISNYGVLDLTSDSYIGLSNNTGSVYISNLGVQSLTAGVDMTVSSNTGTVTIDNTSTLQSVTYRGGSTNNAISITNQVYSANTANSQALLVSGGIGALVVTASVIFDDGNRVLTNVIPTAGLGIDITSYTVAGTTASFTVENLGVLSITAGTDTAVTANSGDVVVFTTSTLQSVTDRGAYTTNSIFIDNTASSSTTIVGNALVVAGGIGADALYIAGTIYTNGQAVATTESISTNSVSAIYTGPGISVDNHTGTVTVSNTGVIAIVAGTDVSVSYTGTYPGSGVVTINDTSSFRSVTYKGSTTPYSLSLTSSTNATSTTTGALVLTGGLGVGRDIWARDVYSNGAVVVTTATIGNLGVSQILAGTGISVSGVTGNVTISNSGVTQLNGSTYIGVSAQTGNVVLVNLGVTNLNSGTDITLSATTGSITINDASTLQSVTSRGGTTNRAVAITNNTSATNSTTGALTVAGGVGIAGDLYVGRNTRIGGNIQIDGTVIIQGTSTQILSTNTVYTENVLELHRYGASTATWAFNDGKYMGLVGNWYDDTVNQPKTWFYGFAPDGKYLEFLDNATDNLDGTFSGTSGSIKVAKILLTSTQTSTSSDTGALVVPGGVGVRGNLNIQDSGQITVGINLQYPPLPDTPINTIANVNSYSQVNNQNISNGTYASGDFILTADDGDDSHFYLDMGLAGSGYNYPDFNIFKPHDGYFYVQGGDLTLATGIPGNNIEFYTGGTANTSTGLLFTTTNVGVHVLSIQNTGLVVRADTQSINTTSGALIVSGGAAVVRDLWVGGNIVGQTASIKGNTTVGGNFVTTGTSILKGVVSVTNTTSATSTNTGALKVEGGVGIGGDTYIGGTIYSGNSRVLTYASTSSLLVNSSINASTSSFATTSGYALSFNTGTLIANAVNASSSTYASIALSLGSGTYVIANTSVASSTNSGALVIGGGLGVGGAIYAGSGIYSAGAQVLTSVTPVAGTAISITSVSTSGANTTFTVNNTGVTSITGSNYVSVSATTGNVTLYNQGVTNITTGSGIVVTSATGTVNISSIDTLNLVTNRGSTSSAVVYFNNASSSSNSIAGNALQVPNGGIGAGTIYATGNVYANGLQVATISYVSTNTVANIQQGPGISVTANTGSVTVNNTGVIALIAGTDITVSGSGAYPGSGVVTINDTSSFRSVTYRGATTPYAISLTSSTNATSSGTGALIVTGGVGIGKDLQVGGGLTVGSTGVAQLTSVASDTTNTNQTINVDSFAISSYRTAKYLVQAVELGNTPNKVHVEEILVFHDNNGLSTIPSIIQYGLGYNTAELGTWNAIYSVGSIILQFTPNYTPTNLVVKAVRIAVTG